MAAAYPDIAARMRDTLTSWTASLKPPGLPTERMTPTESKWFDAYFGANFAAPAR